MPEKYIYNGQVMQRKDVEDAAKQSNLDVDTYLQKAGIKVVNDNYSYNGKTVSAEEIMQAASESKLGFDDYIQKAGMSAIPDVKKKESSVASAEAGAGFGGGITETSPSISPLKSTPAKEDNTIDVKGITNYVQSLKTPEEKVSQKVSKETAASIIAKSNPLLQVNKNGTRQKTMDEIGRDIDAEFQKDVDAKVELVKSRVYDGTASADEIKSIAGFEKAKPFLSDYLNVYADKDKLPQGDILQPGEHWDTAWKNSTHENSAVAVARMDQSLKSAEEIIASFPGGKIKVHSRTAESAFDDYFVGVPKIDSNNPDELATLIKTLSRPDAASILDAGGNDMSANKEKLLAALHFKLDNIKRTEPLAKELMDEKLSEKMYYAIGDVEHSLNETIAQDPTKREYNTDDRKLAALKRGLNYTKSVDPATYSLVIRGINDKGAISEGDYRNLIAQGQYLENLNTFIGGSKNKELVGTETNFNLDTKGSIVAKRSGILGEFFKEQGLINKTEFSDNEIDWAVKNVDWKQFGMNAPTAKEVDFLKAQEDKWFYDQIPKSGFTAPLIRGFEQPFLAIARTAEDLTSGSVAADYLRSKDIGRLTSGEQLTPDEKGQLGTGVASDRKNLWYSVLEGAGSFLPQILLTKGMGAPFASAAEASVAAAVPRGALTAEQLFNINTATGTLLSSYLQSYGDGYEQALQKTGDPVKAQAIGAVGGMIDGIMEQWLPETRIGRGIVNNLRGDAADKIVSIIRKGGNPADLLKETKGILKPFLAEYLNVTGQEVAEEDAAIILKQLTETIISPKTAADNDLLSDLAQTTWSTALQTFIPAIGSGAAASKNRFTKRVFNDAAIKFDYTKDALQKSLIAGTLNQDEYNKSISLLSTHRNSISEAPTVDAAGKEIDGKNRVEYAYQETQIKLNNEKAKTATDVEKEVLTAKNKEAQDIQREILKVPPVVAEAVAPAAETKVDVPTENSELLTNLQEKATGEAKKEGLQYFIDKAGEDPAAFMDIHGKKMTNQLLEQVPTEKLVENRDYLVNNFGESESTDFLTQIISQREEVKPSVESRTPVQVQKMLTESLSFQQKYAPVDFTDPVTGETKQITAKTAKGIIQKRHDILEKLVNCLT